MAKKTKKIEFDGYDWTELVEPLLGDEYAEEEDDEKLLKALRDYMSKMLGSIGGWGSIEEEELKQSLQYVRDFVKSIYEHEEKHGCAASLIKGLYDIENDEIFIQYTIVLLDCLWT